MPANPANRKSVSISGILPWSSRIAERPRQISENSRVTSMVRQQPAHLHWDLYPKTDVSNKPSDLGVEVAPAASPERNGTSVMDLVSDPSGPRFRCVITRTANQ